MSEQTESRLTTGAFLPRFKRSGYPALFYDEDDGSYETGGCVVHGGAAYIVFCILKLCGERLEAQRKCMELLLFQWQDG